MFSAISCDATLHPWRWGHTCISHVFGISELLWKLLYLIKYFIIECAKVAVNLLYKYWLRIQKLKTELEVDCVH